MSVSIVWFRRDLRLSDNLAITAARNKGLPIICLYNLDTERLIQPDVDPIHIEWDLDCVRELQKEIESIGGVLLFNYGSIIRKLNEINKMKKIEAIFGNEETGLQWSWDRDKLVTNWCNNSSMSTCRSILLGTICLIYCYSIQLPRNSSMIVPAAHHL